MIDLSHLTEEEQGMIMTVLKRDAELKKAEEERIRNLDKILKTDSKADLKKKYLTGEWFYEAKSRRHMDKIHGSEIILASMKPRKAGSATDSSPRTERSKTPSSQGSDIVVPQKPARSLEVLQPSENNSDAEKENISSAVRSPRTPRHNPFNRASLIVVDPPESLIDIASCQHHETEPMSPLKSPSAPESSQTSGGSATSEGSSAGFRPVPKKRTFLSRQTMLENNGPASDAQVGPVGVIPAPRRSLQRGSSESSKKSVDEMPQKSAVPDQVSQSAQPSKSVHDENHQEPVFSISQAFSSSSQEKERKPPSLRRGGSVDNSSDSKNAGKLSHPSTATQDRLDSGPATSAKSDSSADRKVLQKCDEQKDRTQVNHVVNKLILQDTDQENCSSAGTSTMQGLSLPQSTADPEPPISYDLNFIDKSDLHTQTKSNLNDKFKLSTQATSPTGDEEDSIAKVLDWFNRSTDSNDWLNTDDGPEVKTSSKKHAEVRKIKEDVGGVISDRTQDTLEMKREIHEAQELRANKRLGNKEPTKTREVMKEETREQKEEDNESESPQISDLKSFWEKNNSGPKILISKKVKPGDKGQKPAEKDRENTNKTHRVSDVNKDALNPASVREQQQVTGPQSDTGDELDLIKAQEVHRLEVDTLKQRNNHDPTYNQNSRFAASRQLPDRRGSDSEILSVTRPSLKQIKSFDSQLNPESETISFTKPNPQLDSVFQLEEIQKQSEQSKSVPVSLLDTDRDFHRRESPDSSLNKDRVNSPHSNRQGLPHQEVTPERIKQLKTFWEQERRKPMFNSNKPKTHGDGRVARGAYQAKMNKRFTKSEFDLTSIGNEFFSDEEDFDRNNPHFTVLPLNQRMEKSSPSLGTNRAQFKTLRDFWDEATSDTKRPFPSDKPKSPKRKEQMSAQSAGVNKVSSSPKNRSKSPHDRQTGSRSGSDSKSSYSKSSKDSNREERSTKPPSSSAKEPRSPKSRKDTFGNSGRPNSMRRATSMFALSVPEEKDQIQRKIDVHSQSRKPRHNAEESSLPRRPSDDTGSPTPRARAYVPADYRHYLGMTDSTSVHTSLAPSIKDEGSEGKFGYELDLGGPVRASTPVGPEERYNRRNSKMNHRPLWASYSSDTGQESSVSSLSETWSNSRNSSNRDDDDVRNAVRKALKRAEIRPKNMAKSMEDITGSLSPRQERRQDSTDVSSIPSPSSSLYMDSEHLKNMSKSVPSFLQKELSGSVMTMYSADFGNVEVQGSIQFSINYVHRLREFHIFVAECRDLAAVDPKRGRSDPYVKSYLAPDRANLGKRKTSVKKKTLNPTFNEILRYRVRMEYLRTQTLILSVWHNDTFGRNSFLGEVDVDLSKWDFDHTQMNYLALKARTTPTLAPSNGRGEMKLAIRFLPQIIHSAGFSKETPNTGEIHIWVKECKNLPLIRASIDPYVKCFVLPDTSRKSRQKTRVLRRTVNPVFNHTMVYDGIREADLAEACVELTVWDRDRLASNLLGGLRIGPGTGRSYGALADWMDSTPDEVALWDRMKATPNEWVEDVLPLRLLNSAKTAFKSK
ncbi:synaptotagmin-like protein 2 isoform X1 [Xyrichtys novacula]|uniref:Synaptotagmin-like protein 2 n=1 Tax=Xyrichtys novacula TaxID=13765 RepID=A0AAV1FY10_XYRNO|nr:synaptotagmin-like protein 2 isoform X1 [Xyrichtys novacula]